MKDDVGFVLSALPWCQHMKQEIPLHLTYKRVTLCVLSNENRTLFTSWLLLGNLLSHQGILEYFIYLPNARGQKISARNFLQVPHNSLYIMLHSEVAVGCLLLSLQISLTL